MCLAKRLLLNMKENNMVNVKENIANMWRQNSDYKSNTGWKYREYTVNNQQHDIKKLYKPTNEGLVLTFPGLYRKSNS